MVDLSGDAVISSTDSGGAQTYLLYDGLASTTGLADGSGNNSVSYSYDVFGAIRSQARTSANYWLFTGEQRDVSEALYYLRARYYDPGTGRFLSQDPLGIGHQYGYVHGNPVNALDPYGLFCIGPKELCNVVKDVVNKPINDVKDTVDDVEVLISHPGSVIQQTGGLAVARFSFGDRFEREDAVFYSHCDLLPLKRSRFTEEQILGRPRALTGASCRQA